MASPPQQQDNQPVRPVGEREATAAGNYFVANYPPFSFWQREQTERVGALLTTPAPATPLGLYVHIPFCRKRCDFCYFRVYTDNDRARVERYLDAVLAEAALWTAQPYLRGRKPEFVYFGGGTPSYLSVDQLTRLFEGLQQHMPWDAAQEVTFECEPGTLQEKKVHALRELGVTRLSLGVENFDPEILELNNRAHRAKEIHRAYGWARDAGFAQVNLDLIAGMVGETDANWQDCIAQTRALTPESVTIYQMEIPYNTTIYQRMQDGGKQVAPVADWDTKRRWVAQAFAALEQDGYLVGSAYTAKKNADVQFRYRDGLWHGADLLGLGVASFGHLGGIHVQNEHDYDPYVAAVEDGALPIHRALELDSDQKLIREWILQLKLGHVPFEPFRAKFGVDPAERFAGPLRELVARGDATLQSDAVTLTRDALLRVDTLLPAFYQEQHRAARYA